jgi:hypothetical protein
VRQLLGCLTLVVGLSLPAFAQERLVLYPSFGGAHFEYEKDTAVYQVTPRQVSQILFEVPDAHREFKKARMSSTWSGILGFVGAGLVILPTATAVAGGNPEWAYAAGGAALLAGSIPLSILSRKRTLRAFELFNQRKGQATLIHRSQLHLAATGARLVIRF